MPDKTVERSEFGDRFAVRYKDEGDASFAPVTDVPTHTSAFEVNASGDPLYIGRAPIGTAKSAAAWQIRKCVYDANGLTDVQWADGNSDYDNIWNNRAGLSYS